MNTLTEDFIDTYEGPVPISELGAWFDQVFEPQYWTTNVLGQRVINPDDPNLSALGRQAVAYARMGLLVFPKRPGGKEPIAKGGYKIATNNEVQVASWWTDYPHANIGIATGIPTEHGELVRDPLFVSVVDFDHKKMAEDGAVLKNGLRWLYLWEEFQGLGLGERVIGKSTTRHGGVHLWYLASDAKFVQPKGAHMDFLGTGNSVTAPGSLVPVDMGVKGSGAYTWVAGRELNPALMGAHIDRAYDKFCQEWFGHPGIEAPKPKMSRPQGSGDVSKLSRKLAESMAEESEGGRNRALYSKACYLFEQYPNADPSVLREAALQTGLDEVEVESVLRSAAATTGAHYAG